MVNSVTYFALIFKLVETPGGVCGGGGEGGNPILLIWLGPFWGVQKNEYFGGMKKLWIFFRGHYTIGLNWEIISIHFRAFC